MAAPNGESNGVKATLPGGVSVEASGRYVSLSVMLLLVVWAGYIFYQQLVDIHREIRVLTVTVERMGCVLSIQPSLQDTARRYGDPCEWILLKWRDHYQSEKK